jgi:hypothetical protein
MGFTAETEMDAMAYLQSACCAVRSIRGRFRQRLRGPGCKMDCQLKSFEIKRRIQVSQEISIPRRINQTRTKANQSIRGRPIATSAQQFTTLVLTGFRAPADDDK